LNLAQSIKTEPLLFDKILEPIRASLDQLDQHPFSQASKKLFYAAFVRVLLFRVFNQIRSLRDLTLDLKTSQQARLLKLPMLGLSTLHDAFARYPVKWLISLIQHLKANYSLAEVAELNALGEVWAADSSYWPIVNQLGWLASQGLKGVRLHLGLSLNTMCAAAFLLTYDTASTSSEKACLLAMVRDGVTYVMDRGYVSIAFCRQLMEQGAFFVIRERNNTRFRSLSDLVVEAHPCLQRLASISDQIGKFTRDKDGTILRLVCFTACGHQFRLLTNRFDLATHQIVLLYAWRWQVELIFRAWKHTLGGLHLINLTEAGIAAQFHILLLASILWALLQQTSESLAPTVSADGKTKQSRCNAKTITAQVSEIFQVSWRLLRPALRLCKNCLAQTFSYYLKERQALA
jgi:DDE family transposase